MAVTLCPPPIRLAMSGRKMSGSASFKNAKPLGKPFSKGGANAGGDVASRVKVTKYKS